MLREGLLEFRTSRKHDVNLEEVDYLGQPEQ